MSQTPLTVTLEQPASEMAREEIVKQVAFLARGIHDIRFSEDAHELRFNLDDPAEGAPDVEALTARALEVARQVQRSLRRLTRKVVYTSSRVTNPVFHPTDPIPGVVPVATGFVLLEGLALALFRYFDRCFVDFGREWNPIPLQTPTLIAADVLARCDYFRSFPHNVTFAGHLAEDIETIEAFRAIYRDATELDRRAPLHFEAPRACLSPAVCYHTYALNQGRTLAPEGVIYSVAGKCFRYEGTNLADLRRLWDFTMREVVFLGSREVVLAHRARSIEKMGAFLEAHELAAEIRTASDPFFVAPDAGAKTYFQLSSETKFEIAALLPDGGRLAIGSHNHHSDVFGRAFNVNIEGQGPMHSVCVGFGLERWVYAFVQQHGTDPRSWPQAMHTAPELAGLMRAF